jgi:hypothetical protein
VFLLEEKKTITFYLLTGNIKGVAAVVTGEMMHNIDIAPDSALGQALNARFATIICRKTSIKRRSELVLATSSTRRRRFA